MDNLGRGKWFYIHPTEQGGGRGSEARRDGSGVLVSNLPSCSLLPPPS